MPRTSARPARPGPWPGSGFSSTKFSAKDLNDADVLGVKELVAASGFDGIDPQNVTKVASAKTLYNFDALKNQSY